jgi:nitroimidazol reductase NimA-like FMN-containing flavoprotein (pyridoxamine 5'-phosphate oxidase superfamily)
MASSDSVESDNRELTETERGKFIESNYFGFLAFAKGYEPYVIPVSYTYQLVQISIPKSMEDLTNKNKWYNMRVCE